MGEYNDTNYIELKHIQSIELEMLIVFDKICRENGLKYFLDSGTALGAKRHKGFIPWDDDIDVGMQRDDYEKFIEIGQEALGDDFFLQNRVTDPNVPFSFSKIRKNGTEFVEYNKRNIKMNHGIFIDIFPYDKLPKTNAIKHIKRCRRLHRLLLFKYVPGRVSRCERRLKWVIGSVMRYIIHYLAVLIPAKALDNKILNDCTKYNDSVDQRGSYTCYSFSKCVQLEYSTLFPVAEHEFEKYSFYVPAKIEKYLSEIYGDYMKLPPEEERLGHRPFKVSI